MARREVTAGHIDVAAAVDALSSGRIVAYPTETVYGLGVDARRADAIASMIALKGRDDGRGISLLVADLDVAMELLASAPPDDARRLVEAFWPGPLTIVLPAAASVAAALRGPSGGVGLRCSSDPWAQELARSFGSPITSTSANRTGDEPARSADEVRRAFALAEPGERAASPSLYVLDGGPRNDTSVSTVVEFSDGRATVRRAGAIATEQIASIIAISP